MPKAKEKHTPHWKRMHKIKVHHNRWLIWAMSAAVLVAAALIGYIKVSDIHFDSQMLGGDVYGSNWTTFTHHDIGYSLKYPRAWGVEAETESSISFVSSKDVNEYFTVSVYDSRNEQVIRNSLFNTEEEEVVVSGRDGIMISQDKTKPENVVMVEDGNELYVFRGRGAHFEQIVNSFRWTQKIE